MIELPSLPIVAVLPAVAEATGMGRAVVLEAPPGAGKSTVVPLALLDAPWLGDGRIVMLEPRRIAARAVAERMARSLREQAGERVGFRTRLETRVGPRTRIEVVTEGILTRMLQQDAALEGIACVIFDEFHERNLQADLGLALALECRRHLRPDLRLIVMSATLDTEAIAAAMGDAVVVRAPGRMFDVQTLHTPGPMPPPGTPTGRPGHVAGPVASLVREALGRHEGDLLAFLPGAGEIRRVHDALAADLPASEFSLRPLYGDLAAADQDAALRPDDGGRRKVVLATNIAETSLTIEGVRIVVDAGLERRLRFDPTSGMSRLVTARISRASADQRRGRAGRTAPGTCYRLWSESTHAALPAQAAAEILEADLAPLALELACWGCIDPASLRWLDPPPPAPLAQARDLLRRLGAIDADGRATTMGRAMATLGIHPRLAHMVLRARPLGQAAIATEIAAVLSERDPLRGEHGARDPDLRVRLDALHGHAAPHGMSVDRAGLRRIARVAAKIQSQLARAPAILPRATPLDTRDAAGLLLAFAYPDRIGRARAGTPGRYALSGGRGAVLPGPAALARSEYIVVAALDAADRDARISLAAALDPQLLEAHFAAMIDESTRIEWDPRSESVDARRLRRIGQLVLREEPLHRLGDAAIPAMLDGIRSLGLRCLPWTRDLEQWRDRVAFLRAQDPSGPGGWPDVGDAALLDRAADWLAPWLEGITRRDQLARIDLRSALHALLDWDARARLERLAPTHLTVPSGSRIAVDYSTGTPTIAVRLQEVFGLSESPRVADGRVPVTLELLSPARRPVQVTRDLESFWASGYHEVRRELRGRYPKHAWPDDPLAALPTRRVRR